MKEKDIITSINYQKKLIYNMGKRITRLEDIKDIEVDELVDVPFAVRTEGEEDIPTCGLVYSKQPDNFSVITMTFSNKANPPIGKVNYHWDPDKKTFVQSKDKNESFDYINPDYDKYMRLVFGLEQNNMGKRIYSQARGKGSLTYRVRPIAYKYKISYPSLNIEGVGKVIRLINSLGHTAPLAEIEVVSISNIKSEGNSEKLKESSNPQDQLAGINKERIKNKKIRFFVPAVNGIYEEKEIYIGKRPENKPPEIGDILKIKDIKQGTTVFNVEAVPGNGGKYFRSSGSFGIITTKDDKVEIQVKRRKIKLHKNCRAIIGIVGGDGRIIKPFVKAGKKYYKMKSVGRKWHRTSAVKMNIVDHPFGSGRGKRIKSKIAKRNAPPGAKVGHIRPRKTGRGKEILV